MLERINFIATKGQTLFYIPEIKDSKFVMVFLNGMLQTEKSDFCKLDNSIIFFTKCLIHNKVTICYETPQKKNWFFTIWGFPGM